jgi:hypothetical protein
MFFRGVHTDITVAAAGDVQKHVAVTYERNTLQLSCRNEENEENRCQVVLTL